MLEFNKHTTNRLLKIEIFAHKFFNREDSRSFHNTEIDKVFGFHGNELSNELIKLLLIRDRSPEKLYVPGVKSLSYTFNWNNFLHLFQQAGLIRNTGTTLLLELKSFKEHQKNHDAKEIFDLRFFHLNNSILLKKNAEYVECKNTGRLLSQFQNTSKKIKKIFFKNWYDYDINSCSYTLVHQHYINNVLPWFVGSFPSWAAVTNEIQIIPKMYLQKSEMRTFFANALGINEDMVKIILQSIFFDAKLNESQFSFLFKNLVANEIDVVKFYINAKACEELQELIREVRRMWPKIMMHYNAVNGSQAGRKKFTKVKKGSIDGVKRFRPASFRAAIYFSLERKVLNVVIKFIKKKVCHLMHDGFIIKNEIDIELLKHEIYKETGFIVSYSQDQF